MRCLVLNAKTPGEPNGSWMLSTRWEDKRDCAVKQLKEENVPAHLSAGRGGHAWERTIFGHGKLAVDRRGNELG